MIDLHFHSYYSDGIYSPKDLVKKLKENSFNFVSLTDHNTIDGVEEFLKEGKKVRLKLLSGVEIYTNYQNKNFHLLGYGFDLKNKELNRVLKELQAQRIPRVKKAIKILQNEGWEINEKEVFNTESSYLGLVHLANPLVKHPKNWERIKKDFNWFEGKIIPITEIIVKYFIRNKKSICPETEISIEQAIKLIKSAGGQSVLAHPGQQLFWKDDNLIFELQKMGLDGVEAISSHHSWQEIEHWQKVAKELGLIITAGSDFHGDLPKEWGFPISSQWEYFTPTTKLNL
ncbi:PHP domain-containing protein [Patescibacteria group bacterium]|nr:PHP domain-containing protein [Patescibacteria group bacterium]